MENESNRKSLKHLKLSSLFSDYNNITKKIEKTTMKKMSRQLLFKKPIYTNFCTIINKRKIEENNYFNGLSTDIYRKRKINTKKKINFPVLLNRQENNKSSSFQRKSVFQILGLSKPKLDGFNSYQKINANKALIQLNRKLLEETLKRLSLPKYQKHANKESPKNKTKIERAFGIYEPAINNYTSKDKFMPLKTRSNSNEKKISLYERVKKKAKKDEMKLLKSKYKELEICEKKFDGVIARTLKMLNDDEKSLYFHYK